MKIGDILKLVNAGYSKDEIDEIAAFYDTKNQKTDEKKEQKTDEKKEQKTDEKKDNSFDYDKFAAALVKAQQLANGKTNYGGSNEKPDISKFF
jgi:hypothetical protein|nr:MAG TPA: hypothetical protein [Caudoviricetes sp.]